MDRPTKDAILTLRRAYRKQEWDQGRTPRTHQISRMVREAILRWERKPGDYPKICPLRPHRLIIEKLSVRLDACSRAMVRFQAQAHNRSEAAALRAIICSAAAPRRAWTATAESPLLRVGRQEIREEGGKFFTVRIRGEE